MASSPHPAYLGLLLENQTRSKRQQSKTTRCCLFLSLCAAVGMLHSNSFSSRLAREKSASGSSDGFRKEWGTGTRWVLCTNPTKSPRKVLILLSWRTTSGFMDKPQPCRPCPCSLPEPGLTQKSRGHVSSQGSSTGARAMVRGRGRGQVEQLGSHTEWQAASLTVWRVNNGPCPDRQRGPLRALRTLSLWLDFSFPSRGIMLAFTGSMHSACDCECVCVHVPVCMYRNMCVSGWVHSHVCV